MGFDGLQIFLLVALETNLFAVLNQQLLLAGLVRIVASEAFAIAGGVMFESRLAQSLLEVIVAFKTEFSIRLQR